MKKQAKSAKVKRESFSTYIAPEILAYVRRLELRVSVERGVRVSIADLAEMSNEMRVSVEGFTLPGENNA